MLRLLYIRTSLIELFVGWDWESNAVPRFMWYGNGITLGRLIADWEFYPNERYKERTGIVDSTPSAQLGEAQSGD